MNTLVPSIFVPDPSSGVRSFNSVNTVTQARQKRSYFNRISLFLWNLQYFYFKVKIKVLFSSDLRRRGVVEVGQGKLKFPTLIVFLKLLRCDKTYTIGTISVLRKTQQTHQDHLGYFLVIVSRYCQKSKICFNSKFFLKSLIYETCHSS